MTSKPDDEATFPMRVVTRLASVSPERLRAWETRHGAIVPTRTEGGARRYSAADLQRIRALRAAVERGRRIGDVAHLSTEALLAELEAAQSAEAREKSGGLFDDAREAIMGFETDRLRALLDERIQRLGMVDFARTEAIEFVAEVGRHWADDVLTISQEHFAVDVLRTLLTDWLMSSERRAGGPRILFATTPGEHHDVGLLVAAVVAAARGASVVFVGANVPEEDLARAVRESRADVLALGFVIQGPDAVEASLKTMRRLVSDRVAIWAGGRGIDGVAPVRGVDRVPGFERLEAFVVATGRTDAGLDVAEGGSS